VSQTKKRLLVNDFIHFENINDYIINLAACCADFRHSTDREVALMMLMAYLSYMLAEVHFWSDVAWKFTFVVLFC
jgi:hypothetical protein